MTVKTIIDNEQGRKWEINKHGEDDYTVAYFEFFQSIGWRELKAGPVEHWSKEALESEFDCKVA